MPRWNKTALNLKEVLTKADFIYPFPPPERGLSTECWEHPHPWFIFLINKDLGLMKLLTLKHSTICCGVYKANFLRYSQPQISWHNRVTVVSSFIYPIGERGRQNCVIAWWGLRTFQNCLVSRKLRFLGSWICVQSDAILISWILNH